MILGRNAGLWAAVVQAALNVLAATLVIVNGRDLTPAELALFAAVNVFCGLVVGLIANEADPTARNLTRWGNQTPVATPDRLARVQELAPISVADPLTTNGAELRDAGGPRVPLA